MSASDPKAAGGNSILAIAKNPDGTPMFAIEIGAKLYVLAALSGSAPLRPARRCRAAIQQWSTQHPGATAVPVSIIGEKSQLPMVFVWAVDGSDNLNVHLVWNGVHPAIGMLKTVKFGRLLQASANAPFVKRAAQGERAGNPTGVTSRRLIPKVRYDTYVKELIAAETLAARESLGIWSDSFKKVREQIGLVPLSSLPLTIDELESY